MLTIETTRYSTVVAAFIDRFPDAQASLNKRRVNGPCSVWATNKALLGAVDLSIRQGSTELLGFHDGPRNMWASDVTVDLVQELASAGVLRYRQARKQGTSLFRRILMAINRE